MKLTFRNLKAKHVPGSGYLNAYCFESIVDYGISAVECMVGECRVLE
jgi:hypothetical protein